MQTIVPKYNQLKEASPYWLQLPHDYYAAF